MVPDTVDQIPLGKSNLILDLRQRGLFRDGERIHLPLKPFEVLVFLAKNRGRFIPKQEILATVWGEFRDKNTVEQAVRQIRLALGDDLQHPKFIETRAGHGYCFIAPSLPESMAPDEVVPVSGGGPSDFTDAGSDQIGQPIVGSKRSIPRRTLFAIAGGAILAGGAVTYRFLKHGENPERAVLTGSLLTVLDGLGRTLWTHRFQKKFRSQVGIDTWDVQVLDLAGDGRRGVLVTCNFISGGVSDSYGDDGQLFYFGPDGSLKWTLSANPQLLDFNSQPFESSWNFSHVIATPAKTGLEIWASVRHSVWWPGCVLRVNAYGRSHVHFANSGQINRLCFLNREGTGFLVFSGENNAFSRGGAGLVGIDDPPSSSPSGGPERYRYSNGPLHEPRSYVLFPTTEIAIARQIPYCYGTEIYSHGRSLLVNVINGDGASYLLYALSDMLEPKSVTPCDGYPIVHQSFEQTGLLHHTWENCPELKSPLTIRRFERGAGWRDWSVPWQLPTKLS